MNENGGNNAKIKRVQPQPSPWKGENVGKKTPDVEFQVEVLRNATPSVFYQHHP
jgi:hypothetical protein